MTEWRSINRFKRQWWHDIQQAIEIAFEGMSVPDSKIIDTPGTVIQVLDMLDMLGMQGHDTAMLAVTDCVVDYIIDNEFDVIPF